MAFLRRPPADHLSRWWVGMVPLRLGMRRRIERGEFHSEELELLPSELAIEPMFDEIELEEPL